MIPQTIVEQYPDYQAISGDLWHYQRSLINYEITETGLTRINIDEDQIDLTRQFDQSVLEPYKPKVTLAPWAEVQKVYFDIETTGLDPNECEIKAIGIIDTHSSIYKDGCLFLVNGKDTQNLASRNVEFFDSEEDLLYRFFEHLEKCKKTDNAILGHYNGWVFDWPFILKRCEMWGIKPQVWIPDWLTVDSTAQRFGKPVSDPRFGKGSVGFKQVYAYGFAGVDVLHKVMSYDFVARKLTQGYSLKQVPYELNLETEIRKDLSFPEMLECYRTDDWRTLLTYLKDDLVATKKVGDFILPPYYYQLPITPWISLQSIFTRGNGGKWNDLIASEYLTLDYNNPKSTKVTLAAAYEMWQKQFNPPFENGIQTEKPKKYVGGLTGAVGGLFWNVGKIDVASLYPSIMLAYGIYSYKDINANILRCLKYLKDARIAIKNKKDRTEDENLYQGALKVFINSGYGGLATTGIIFNDYESAALVTAYGRKILKVMCQEIQKYGVNVEIDTDGIYFASNFDHEELTKIVQSVLPDGIDIENELFGECILIPIKDIDLSNSVRDDKKYYPGLRKNYIIGNIGKMKVSGKFRKRDQPEYLKKYLPKMVESLIKLKNDTGLDPTSVEFNRKAIEFINRATDNYKSWIIDMFTPGISRDQSGDDLVKSLLITRKARANETKIFQSGLVDNEGIARYFLSYQPHYGKRGQILKKNPYTFSGVIDDNVVMAYHNKIDEQMDMILECIQQNIKIELGSSDGTIFIE